MTTISWAAKSMRNSRLKSRSCWRRLRTWQRWRKARARRLRVWGLCVFVCICVCVCVRCFVVWDLHGSDGSSCFERSEFYEFGSDLPRYLSSRSVTFAFLMNNPQNFSSQAQSSAQCLSFCRNESPGQWELARHIMDTLNSQVSIIAMQCMWLSHSIWERQLVSPARN